LISTKWRKSFWQSAGSADELAVVIASLYSLSFFDSSIASSYRLLREYKYARDSSQLHKTSTKTSKPHHYQRLRTAIDDSEYFEQA
jgi:hypothetical protein